ncbi:MAG: hypothetical protein IT437_01610 [Phycisphaerales bacterium]|nr:hypothetical protein [Phycisphaerales bacterium]
MNTGPKKPPDERTLPHPLTFFVTAAERAIVLRRLRRYGRDRRRALLNLVGCPRVRGNGRS